MSKRAAQFEPRTLIARPAEGKVFTAAGLTLAAWDAADGRLLWTTEFNELVDDVRVSREQDVVVLCGDGSVRKVDGLTGAVLDDYYNILGQFVPFSVETT